jgi:hypothetical protein
MKLYLKLRECLYYIASYEIQNDIFKFLIQILELTGFIKCCLLEFGPSESQKSRNCAELTQTQKLQFQIMLHLLQKTRPLKLQTQENKTTIIAMKQNP